VDLENPFEAESFREGQAEALRPSSGHQKPDLVIAVMDRTDVSQWERNYFAAVHSELLGRQDKVKEIDIIGPQLVRCQRELLRFLLIRSFCFSSFNQKHVSQPSEPGICSLQWHNACPTYSMFAQLSLDHGGIGGAHYDWRKDAVSAGQIAARALSGERMTFNEASSRASMRLGRSRGSLQIPLHSPRPQEE
jgi:hypothetical protein